MEVLGPSDLDAFNTLVGDPINHTPNRIRGIDHDDNQSAVPNHWSRLIFPSRDNGNSLSVRHSRTARICHPHNRQLLQPIKHRKQPAWHYWADQKLDESVCPNRALSFPKWSNSDRQERDHLQWHLRTLWPELYKCLNKGKYIPFSVNND